MNREWNKHLSENWSKERSKFLWGWVHLTSYLTSLCFYPGTLYLPSSCSVSLSYVSYLVRLEGSSKPAEPFINIFYIICIKYLDFQIYSINITSPTCLLLAAALPFAHPCPLQVMLLHFSILLGKVWLCCQKIQTVVNTALYSLEATIISCYLNGGICSQVLLPDKSSCSACKQKTHPAVVQVYRRYLGEPRFPNRATQSFAYVPTTRQDSSGSPSNTDSGLIHPFTEKRKCSTPGVSTACSVVPPWRDFPSQKCCLCVFFLCLSGIGPFHLAESAQACWRSFETECNLLHAFSPVFHICSVFLGAAFLVLRKTGDLHSNVIKSLPEALNSSTWPGQAAACLLCFRWWQNRVEEDRAEELTIHSQLPTCPISKYFRADIKTAKKEEILS